MFHEFDTIYKAEHLNASVLHYPPRWVTLGINSACTNRCIFCGYHSPDARKKSNVYNIRFEMSVERFKQHVDFFYAGKVPHVHICATGEPFLHNGIMEMIDYTINKYGDVSFQSNFNHDVMKRQNYLPQILERKEKISYIACDFNAADKDSFANIKKGSTIDDVLNTFRLLSSSGIPLHATFILTKDTYSSLLDTIGLLAKNEIKMSLTVVNIFPYMFNDFTAFDKIYTQKDEQITLYLEKAKEMGKRLGITVNIPNPSDSPKNKCSVFWEKLQVWPVAGVKKERYDENIIPHGCNAVVLGEMNSLGYVFDFKNVMELWNSPKIVAIRERILSGHAPDAQCKFCPQGHYLK